MQKKHAVLNFECVQKATICGLTESRQWVRDENNDINNLYNLDGTIYHKVFFVLNNDISLLRMADIGYATENAIREVKAVADKIAPSNTENAIACIINSLNTKADTSGQ